MKIVLPKILRIMIEVKDDRIVATMTVGELKEVMGMVLKEHLKIKPPHHFKYGLKAIQELFGVSHATAQMYKNTFLAPAVRQHNRTIIVDVELARELFKENKKSRWFPDPNDEEC